MVYVGDTGSHRHAETLGHMVLYQAPPVSAHVPPLPRGASFSRSRLVHLARPSVAKCVVLQAV